MKKQKGFTLTELLGVLIILSIIALLLVPTINKTLKNFKQDSYEDQIKGICVSSENWKTDHYYELPENDGEILTITLGTLKNGGYVDYKLTDPLTGKYFPNDMLIELTKSGKSIKCNVITNSGSDDEDYSINTPTLSLKGASNIQVDVGATYIEPGYIARTATGFSIPDSKVVKEYYLSGKPVSGIDTSKNAIFQIKYSVTDKGETVSVTRTVTVKDMTPPVITINGHSSDKETEFTIKHNAGDPFTMPVATVTDNSKENIKAVVSGTVSDKVPGTYTVTYTATDSSGNKATLKVIFVVTDVTPPNVEIIGVPTSWTNKSVTIAVNASDSGVGLHNVPYSYDGGKTWQTGNTIIVDSNRTLEIWVRDQVGNTKKTSVTIDKIDKNIPDIVFSVVSGTSGTNGWYKSNIQLKLTPTSGSSGVKEYKYCIGTGQCTPTSIVSGAIATTLTLEKEITNNQVCTVIESVSGSINEKCSSLYKIDKTAPAIKIASCPATGDCSVTVEATKSAYTIPSATATDNLTTTLTVSKSGSVTPSIPGTYYINYSATDDAGNTGTSKLTVVVVDTTKPHLEFTMSPATPNGLSSWYKSNVKFDVTATDVQSIKTLQYSLSTDGGNTWGSYTNITNNTFTISTQGSNLKVRMRAVDASNNEMIVDSGTFKIDTVSPTISSVSGNPTAWTNKDITLTVNASDATSKVKEYSFDGGSTWQTANTKIFNNNQTVSMVVRDNAGNISSTNTQSITKIDKIAPVITVSGHTSNFTVNHEASSSFSIPTGTATDNSKETITVSNTGSVTPTIPGTYKITYTATDPAGNTATLIMTVVVADTKAPTFTVSGNPTSWTNKDVTLTVNASDTGSGLHKSGAYSFDNGGTWQTSASKVFSSNQTVTIKVRDNAGNIANAQTVTINRIDKTTPSATFAFVSGTAGSNGWYKSDVVVKITPTAGGSGVTSYKYCTTTSSCTPSTSVSGSGTTNVTLSGNSATNKVCVITTNGAGVSSGTVCSSVYKIDKVTPPAPTITMKLKDANGATYSGACTKENVYVELTGSTTSGISKFEWNDGSWKTESLTTSGNKGTITFTTERNQTIKFRGTNNAGTVGSEASKVIKIDRTAPTIKITGCTANGNCTLNIEATNSYTIPSATASDGCGISSTTPTKSGSVTANLPGTYYVTYTATDIAGNTGTAQLTVVVKDTTKPNITFTMDPAQPNGSNNWYTSSVKFTTNMTDISGVVTQQYALSTDGGNTWGSYTNITNNTFTISTQGSNLKVRMKAVDKANNTTTVDSGIFKIDTANPTISSVTGNPTAWTKNDVTLTVNPGSDVSGIASYSFDNGTTWQTAKTKTFSSNQTVNIKVKDNAGRVSSASSVTINKIDKTPPVITIAGCTNTGDCTKSQNVASSYTIPNGTATDNSGSTITVTKSGTVTPSVAGTYTVTYTATDPAGNTATAKLTITFVDTNAHLLKSVTTTYGTISKSGTIITVTLPFGQKSTTLTFTGYTSDTKFSNLTTTSTVTVSPTAFSTDYTLRTTSGVTGKYTDYTIRVVITNTLTVAKFPQDLVSATQWTNLNCMGISYNNLNGAYITQMAAPNISCDHGMGLHTMFNNVTMWNDGIEFWSYNSNSWIGFKTPMPFRVTGAYLWGGGAGGDHNNQYTPRAYTVYGSNTGYNTGTAIMSATSCASGYYCGSYAATTNTTAYYYNTLRITNPSRNPVVGEMYFSGVFVPASVSEMTTIQATATNASVTVN